MRITLLVASLLLSGFTILAVTPTTEAVGVCTGLKDSWCDALLCIGYRRDSTGFHCQREVPWPCQPCPYP